METVADYLKFITCAPLIIIYMFAARGLVRFCEWITGKSAEQLWEEYEEEHGPLFEDDFD